MPIKEVWCWTILVASIGGALMGKDENKAFALLNEMAYDSYQMVKGDVKPKW